MTRDVVHNARFWRPRTRPRRPRITIEPERFRLCVASTGRIRRPVAGIHFGRAFGTVLHAATTVELNRLADFTFRLNTSSRLRVRSGTCSAIGTSGRLTRPPAHLLRKTAARSDDMPTVRTAFPDNVIRDHRREQPGAVCAALRPDLMGVLHHFFLDEVGHLDTRFRMCEPDQQRGRVVAAETRGEDCPPRPRTRTTAGPDRPSLPCRARPGRTRSAPT